MHKSILELFAILLIFIYFSCSIEDRIEKEISFYYQKGEFQKVIEVIQKYEIEKEQLNPKLYIWKARIYSIYPETYGLSKTFYNKYLKNYPEANYYYEYTLFLIDINDYEGIKELISGENIPPFLIFHPIIGDIRKFVECRINVLEGKYLNSLNLLQSIHDLYLFNHCSLFLYKNIYDKFLLKENSLSSLSTLKDLSTKEKIHQIEEYLQSTNFKNKNINYLKELISLFKKNNFESQESKNQEIYCNIQKHFPEFKISLNSLEKCIEFYPYSLTLYRTILNYRVQQIEVNPIFDNSIYKPLPSF